MSKIAHMFEPMAKATSMAFLDDFLWLISPHLWTTTLTDSGTATVADGACGIVPMLPSDGTVADNDEAYLATTNAFFPFASNKPIYAEALLQFTEAATNAANVAFGLASAVAANLILDDGAGMRTTGTIFAIYKVDGSLNWNCVSRIGTTVFTNVSSTVAGKSAYQTLSVELLEELGTAGVITFKVDGDYLRDATTLQIIRHVMPYAGATAMQLFAGVKNGSAVQQPLNVDYMAWTINRDGYPV